MFVWQLDADGFPELCEKFQLDSVPAFLFLHAGALADSVMGADVPSLVNKVKQHNLSASIAKPDSKLPAGPTASLAEPTTVSLDDRLRALTHQAPVVLFMKGNAEAPRCGFSRQAVELLQQERVEFSTFDILGDEEVRQGLKKFSNWPTYPQLYAEGKLVGGLDIMKDLREEGELIEPRSNRPLAPACPVPCAHPCPNRNPRAHPHPTRRASRVDPGVGESRVKRGG